MVKRLKEYLNTKQTTNNGTENTIQKNKDWATRTSLKLGEGEGGE
jgi:hypothetical protein